MSTRASHNSELAAVESSEDKENVPGTSVPRMLRSAAKRGKRLEKREDDTTPHRAPHPTILPAKEQATGLNSEKSLEVTKGDSSPLPCNEEEEEEEEMAAEPGVNKFSTFTGCNPLAGFTDQCVTEDIVETYFSQGSSISRMYPDIDEMLLEQVVQTDTENLLNVYRGLFNYWYCQLKAGFNILLYGLGSKISLLAEFCKVKLSKCYVMIVYGFFPGLALKDILNTITSEIFEHSGRFKSISLQCEFICSTLCQKESTIKELFLIVHSIDGRPLQDKKTQYALSLLAACPYIHIIASIDHPRAPLLWDEVTMGRFNWVWHQATTYDQYTTELSYDKTAVSNASDALVMSSVTHVMSSLTPNARGVFQVLADSQLKHKDDTAYVGLSFSELYQKCREKFLVSSDMSLRAQLTEFRDHKLVLSKKGQDGTELLTVPIKISLLEQLMNE